MWRARARTLGAALLLASGVAWWSARHEPLRAPAGDHAATYQCAMHPQVVAPEAGRCPICGMTLARVEPATAAAAEHEGGDEHASHAAFALTPAREQLIGVATEAVAFRELHRDLGTAGRVAYDPDLYGALSDYQAAVRAEEDAQRSGTPQARERADGLRRTSAMRLGLLGLSFAQIAEVAAAGADPANLLLPLQSAWIYGQVYEQAPDVPRPGQAVRVTSPSLPGRVFAGRVMTADSAGTIASRAVRVRALVATPGGGLRPEAFVRLVIEVPLGRRLAVPDGAVLDTGQRRLVFVREPGGRFTPRDVVVGVAGEGYLEILSGVQPGEHVVTAANFLIDSESRLAAALAAFAAGAAGPRHAETASAP